MTNWTVGALLLAGVIFQSSLMDKITVFGVMPDLVTILAVSFGLIFGPVRGAAAGAVGGMLLDLLLGRFLGLHALTRGLAGYVAGLAEPRIWKDNLAVPAFACFFLTLLSELLVYVLLSVSGRGFDLIAAWRGIILPSAVYNGLLGVPIYRLIFWQGVQKTYSYRADRK